MKYGRNLKEKARKNVRKNYFRNVIVVFICSVLLAGGYSYTTKNILEVDTSDVNISEILNNSSKKTNAEIIDDLLNKTDSEKQREEVIKNKYSAGVISSIINEITASGSIIFGFLNAFNNFLFAGDISVFVLIIFATLISFSFNVLFINVLQVGRNRFFLEKRKYLNTKIDKLLFPYKVRKTLHLSYILFVKQLYQLLWNFTIIGGILKHYQYSMIPYVLAENPNITKNEAFCLSKELTDGQKWNLFKVDLSLLGWNILGAFTFNFTNIFYFNIYKEFIYAEIYMDIRNSKRNDLTYGYLLNDDALNVKEEVYDVYPDEKFSISLKKRKWLNIDYHKKYSLTSYVLFFFTFSFVGWIWEVLLHLIEDGRFVNRGTMLGPWLPIYGFGGVMILFLLKRFRDRPFSLFLSSFVLCGIVEYATAWYLETFNHMKWWDYSGYFLNIHGRVCLEGLLVFGLGGCAFTYLVAPILDNIYIKIKPSIRYTVCLLFILFFSVDFVYSSIHPNSGEGITSYKMTQTIVDVKKNCASAIIIGRLITD